MLTIIHSASRKVNKDTQSRRITAVKCTRNNVDVCRRNLLTHSILCGPHSSTAISTVVNTSSTYLPASGPDGGASSLADRFVLTCVNNRRVSESDFETTQSGAVLLTEAGRRKFLKAWQERKQETITHPYLQEKIPWGLVPYVQALLLARCLRGDLDGYPPFLWK